MRRSDELAIRLTVPQPPERLPIFPVLVRGAMQLEERKMPVLILWAVPAIVVLGGGIYLIGHMH
ncbi:hypothetical protein [Bradyrhizobium sp. 195]|uniref:hypothetical protein n=1 Tax=Bradyrhizobium sp. 195 TaxID=2782662 RepID=UPI002000B3ED|nr:hypothetical protein [Bradyrhizobium sp. 195]UPK27564.1 hypothetical protein IVB26_02815 [Bradyrhizobium sp. 195]